MSFESLATNLDPSDIDTTSDIDVEDHVTGGLTLVSTGSGGLKGNGDSFWPSLSADGTKVAVYSSATDLETADTDFTLDAYVKEASVSPATTADLSITTTDRPDPVVVGSTLTYRLDVANAGPDRAWRVTVTDQLPTGVTFRATVPSQGTCSATSGTVTCALGDDRLRRERHGEDPRSPYPYDLQLFGCRALT